MSLEKSALASSKDTPCFFWFSTFFASSQTTFTAHQCKPTAYRSQERRMLFGCAKASEFARRFAENTAKIASTYEMIELQEQKHDLECLRKLVGLLR